MSGDALRAIAQKIEEQVDLIERMPIGVYRALRKAVKDLRALTADAAPKPDEDLAHMRACVAAAGFGSITECIAAAKAAAPVGVGGEIADARIEQALTVKLGLDHTLGQLIRGDTSAVGYPKVAVVRALLAALAAPDAAPAAGGGQGLPTYALIDSLQTSDALRALCKVLRDDLAALQSTQHTERKE